MSPLLPHVCTIPARSNKAGSCPNSKDTKKKTLLVWEIKNANVLQGLLSRGQCCRHHGRPGVGSESAESLSRHAKIHKVHQFPIQILWGSGKILWTFDTWTVRHSQAFRKHGQIPFIYCQLPRWMNRVSFSQFHKASLPQISCSPLWQVVPTTVHFKCRFVTKLKDENLEEVTSESPPRIQWILQWWSSLCTLNWFVGWKLDFHELRAHGACFSKCLI